MNKYVKGFLEVAVGIPVAIGAYLLIMYVFDMVYQVYLAVLIIPIILGFAWYLFSNLKDFVVSIFKEDDELDERGFKKNF